MSLDSIIVRGAREHNLKNIDVEIPRDKFVVITGVSGSGKSSLAFDTIYAEGQRRYVESLSAYARQFLGLMEKPDVDYIEGLSPAISIDQKGASRNPRSTVATQTEIYDYLRLLYARAGRPHCPECGRPIERQTVQQIVDSVLALPAGKRLMVMAPVVKDRKGEHHQVFEDGAKAGFVRVRVDGQVRDLSEEIRLDRYKMHSIEVIVDRLVVEETEGEDAQAFKTRVADSVETALRLGGGVVQVWIEDEDERMYSEHFACVHCGLSFGEIEPRNFSFNSPHGACKECTGLGVKMEIDPELVITNKDLTLAEGAIQPWARASSVSQWYFRLVEAVADKYGFSVNMPVRQLKPEHLRTVLYGSDERVTIRFTNQYDRTSHYDTTYEGVIPNLERRYRETDSDYVKMEIERYMAQNPCPACKGARLKPESLAVTIDGTNIYSVTKMGVREALEWVERLRGADTSLNEREQTIGRQVLKEIGARLAFLKDVGVDYLTLDRRTGTLAGGEAQRIRLATQIGSGLMGVLYVHGARANNLKGIEVVLPLGNFVCVTGVSGSGKSTLVHEILYKKCAQILYDARERPGECDGISGLEHVDKVVSIDQSPIGRTPRSNPATYTGTFTPIREAFASVPEARLRGYKPGRFSFNVKGGRCEACQGEGYIQIEMQFLPDVEVPCEVCHGARYSREALEITFRGKNVAEVLDMTVEEALRFFEAFPRVRSKLQTLHDVGLGYIRLGQPATTLSGGEAQRVKLSTELSRRATGRTLYILDEPTTGLSFEDVNALMRVLHRLVDSGNTVVVIEHQMDVVKQADHIIDLGPLGGDRGGEIVAEGTPEAVAGVEGSFTGQYLRDMLSKHGQRAGAEVTVGKGR
ncbi:MAG: hypothetical protein HYS09_05710 [Chloroflexi bacterium]|nr:hypothetical protein [Chloroflexota bacterium]